MSAGDLQRVRDRKTKGGGEEANSKVSLRTGESTAEEKTTLHAPASERKRRARGNQAERN